MLPLFVVAALVRRNECKWPSDAWLRPYKGGGGTRLRNTVVVTRDLLWLVGHQQEAAHAGWDYSILSASAPVVQYP